MAPFLVCIHDATPAHARETLAMLDDLAPLLGTRIALGVVPDWHGRWHLAKHAGYCTLVRERADELLLHGYVHRRQEGRGPVSWLTDGADEMNGLDDNGLRQTIAGGQDVFARAFGEPARGFVAPAWQPGRLRASDGVAGLEYVLGFFSLRTHGGHRVPLATWTWDCGRWSWLGHVGHGLARLLQSRGRGIPSLAIHPRDLVRGYWPIILRLIRELLDRGYEPTTPLALARGTRGPSIGTMAIPRCARNDTSFARKDTLARVTGAW